MSPWEATADQLIAAGWEEYLLEKSAGEVLEGR